MEFEDVAVINGVARTFYSVKFPLFDDSGEPYALCGMSTDITEIKRTQDELERHKTRLEEIVAERTRELTAANRELKAEVRERKRMERRLEELSERVISMQEDERARPSHELHDELGQQLTALRLEFDMMKRQVPEVRDSDFAGAVTGMVQRITEDLRRICKGLRPTVLDDLGLSSALTALIRDFEKIAHLEFDVRMDPVPEHRVQPQTAIHIYRVLQESINNIVKHARATRVRVELRQHGHTIHLVVEDNGCGFDTERTDSGGFGIIGMARRAELCGARLTLQAARPSGTRVTLVVPLAPDERSNTQ